MFQFPKILILNISLTNVDVFPFAGGAVSCKSAHVGEIRPGAMRGNHRHHSCNETFVIWGAKTIFRVSLSSLLLYCLCVCIDCRGGVCEENIFVWYN